MKRTHTVSDMVKQCALYFIILRGPILLWICFAALVYRSLRLASVDVQILCSLLFLGCLLTISDWISLTRTKIESIKASLRNLEDKIVLDTVLRDIFSLEHGWIGCIVGGFGLYNLPFTTQQRTSILQVALPKNIPISKAFYHPGGIRYFLPESWQRLEDIPSVDTSFDSTTLQQQEKMTTMSKEGSIHDLFLDDLDDGHIQFKKCLDEASTLDHGDVCDDSATPSSTASTTNLSSPLLVAQDFNRTTIGTSSSHDRKSCTRGSTRGSMGETMLGQGSEESTWTLIIRDFLRTSLNHVLSQMDESTMKNAGIVSTALFCLQMKTSPSSRRIFLQTLQGFMSFGLIGVASGSLSLWLSRRYFLEDSSCLCDRSEREAKEQGSVDSKSVSILSSFLIVKKYMEEKMKSNLSWVQWKRILAAAVFLYIGKMRYRKRNNQIPWIP
jgi:hypothetical protein